MLPLFPDLAEAEQDRVIDALADAPDGPRGLAPASNNQPHPWLPGGSGQTVAYGVDGYENAVLHAELLEDVRHVVLDGVLGDRQLAADGGVVRTGGNQTDDLELGALKERRRSVSSGAHRRAGDAR